MTATIASEDGIQEVQGQTGDGEGIETPYVGRGTTYQEGGRCNGDQAFECEHPL